MLFPVYEVGSLPKLDARVKSLRGDEVTADDIAQVRAYSARLGIDDREVLEIFGRANTGTLSRRERGAIIDFNALANIKLLESVGLDFVFDGEARRTEMYRHLARQVEGFEDLPEMLRSRGPDSWQASVCLAPPHIRSTDGFAREYRFASEHALKPLKVPIDDPFMIANMTDNVYYLTRARADYAQDHSYYAKRDLTVALAKEVIRPVAQRLKEEGARWIQLDIPSATINIGHIPIMVEGINEVVRGIDGVKFSLHLCYPRRVSLTEKKGYELLFPYLESLDPRVDHLSLELAHVGQYALDLAPFAKSSRRFEIALGVTDITLEGAGRETPRYIRDQILKGAAILGDPASVYVQPDCGLRQLSLERAVAVLEATVAGAELARKG